ncbi:MAG: sigma-54-dependent Fis family transcriptional regulator [Nitrospinae bacterium]|nr:sigma-54-dependent Fis family transcriptional regulator [Nitrospinota bacterium]
MERKILIVDDDAGMRAGLTEALRRVGCSVTTASNGFEAVDIFAYDIFDMVITDVKMPRMSGISVLREIKGISPQTPVIMITAYGTIDNAVEAMKEGAFDYILKPFSTEAIESAINRVFLSKNKKDVVKSLSLEVQRGTKGLIAEKKIISNNPRMKELINLARNIAYSKATILIQGESGTGKELFAQFIHQTSPRRDKPFVAVNCAALPEGLLESELFGHEKGSFTGAFGRRIGKFERANYGTILLDEISEMDLPSQAKLLRVLQEYEIDRVGGVEPIPVDVRVIATTNIDLRDAINKGKFREDLFYRLNVIPLIISPLRERKDDIPLLTDYFLKRHSANNGKGILRISEDVLHLLMKYDWKGNVRELENVIERAVLLCDSDVIFPSHLFMEARIGDKKGDLTLKVGVSVKEMERQLIMNTLNEVKGNRTYAADMLGISIRTLRNKIKEYDK